MPKLGLLIISISLFFLFPSTVFAHASSDWGTGVIVWGIISILFGGLAFGFGYAVVAKSFIILGLILALTGFGSWVIVLNDAKPNPDVMDIHQLLLS